MLRMMILGLAFTAGPAAAEGYADHHAVRLFSEAPCGDVLEALDQGDAPELDAAQLALEGVNGYAERLAEQVGSMGMTWGFILGFDAARGGLHEGEETTLARLRAGCEANPDRTALAILEGLD